MVFDYELIDKNTILLIKLDGELVDNLNSDEKIVFKIEGIIKQDVINVIVDLSKIKYISSNGISWLISLLTKFRNKGGELILLNPSLHVKKLLVMTKLIGIFEIFETEREAIVFLNNNK